MLLSLSRSFQLHLGQGQFIFSFMDYVFSATVEQSLCQVHKRFPLCLLLHTVHFIYIYIYPPSSILTMLQAKRVTAESLALPSIKFVSILVTYKLVFTFHFLNVY